MAIPDTVKAALQNAQAELRRALPQKAARWSRREQFHLTLKFLGNVAVSQVEELTRACRKACETHAPLDLIAQQIGFFPNARVVRVVWAGIRDLDGRLPKLWTAIQSAVQPFSGEALEHEFTGHVTLARISRLRREETAELAEVGAKFQNTVFGEWKAAKLDLFRSELLAEGARHTVLAELPLAGDSALTRNPKA